MEPEDIKRSAEEIGRNMAEFAIPLARALVRMRAAEHANFGLRLEADEVKAVLNALRLLKGPRA